MSELDETLDCRACGACCRGAADGRVPVRPDDLIRWRREQREDLIASLVPGHFDEPGLPALPDGTCRYLGAGDRPLDCSIYETRPHACRALEPGSSQCLAYRRAYLAP